MSAPLVAYAADCGISPTPGFTLDGHPLDERCAFSDAEWDDQGEVTYDLCEGTIGHGDAIVDTEDGLMHVLCAEQYGVKVVGHHLYGLPAFYPADTPDDHFYPEVTS